jgi:hypothetical protein
VQYLLSLDHARDSRRRFGIGTPGHAAS